VGTGNLYYDIELVGSGMSGHWSWVGTMGSDMSGHWSWVGSDMSGHWS